MSQPHNLDAERSVLGCLLVEPSRIDAVVGVLTAEHFYSPKHGPVYTTLLEMHARGDAIDLVLVAAALDRAGTLDRVGGPAYLASLTDGVPRGGNLPHYAAVVRELGARRALIAMCQGLLDQAYALETPIETLTAEAEVTLHQIAHGATADSWVHTAEWVGGAFARLEALASSPRHVTGLRTGFAELDQMTHGLQPGDLVVLGARPSMGKTALAVQIALQASQDARSAIFSLEMGHEALGTRAFASEGRIHGSRVQSGALHGADYGRLTTAMETLRSRAVSIDDSPSLTLAQLRAKARRLAKTHGPLGAIFVDYLQLLSSSAEGRRAENRTLELAGMTKGLKQLARELRVPVVVLSQLSRDTAKREDNRPRLSDLRDSGAIEQDADLVLLLHRPEYYQETPKPEDLGRAELIIAKQRSGPTGTVQLRFTREWTRFDDWA